MRDVVRKVLEVVVRNSLLMAWLAVATAVAIPVAIYETIHEQGKTNSASTPVRQEAPCPPGSGCRDLLNSVEQEIRDRQRECLNEQASYDGISDSHDREVAREAHDRACLGQ